MTIVEVFDYSITGLTILIFFFSMGMAIRIGGLSFKQYCCLTYVSLKVGMFSKNWVSAVNWISAAFLYAALVYFDVYAFICTVTVLLITTVIMAVTGKHEIESTGVDSI